MEPTEDGVAGTHRGRLRASAVLRAINGLVWLLIALGYAARQRWWGAVFGRVIALMNLLTGLLVRGQRTVIAPDGIRIKRGLRWRRFSWDDVQSAVTPLE